MDYFVSIGTPIEINDGQTVHSIITDRDLHFTEPEIDAPDEWVFRCNGNRVFVPKALVKVLYRNGPVVLEQPFVA